MALDFTRLSDVALVEEATDTANVLIEESGEIKRVPKTEVGGNGKADLIIRISAGFTDDPFGLTADKFSIESGSLEAVKNKLIDGDIPVVKVKYYKDMYDDNYWVSAAEYLCDVIKYSDDMAFCFINMNGRHQIGMSLADTAYIGYEFSPLATLSGGTVF